MDEVKSKLVTPDDMNRTLESGRKPLHYASDYNQADVVLYLLSKGADINATDRHGFTPLICACYENNVACVKVLLEKGAAKELKTPDGITAFDAAAESEIIQKMLK